MRTNEQKKAAADMETAHQTILKGKQPASGQIKDNPRAATATPDNDSGISGKPEAGNKSGGPKGENL